MFSYVLPQKDDKEKHVKPEVKSLISLDYNATLTHLAYSPGR